MDLENQKRVLALTEEHGAENIVVLLGASEGEASGLAAETVTNGDPTFAGPLTGVQLGLTVFHVCEEEIKSEVLADNIMIGQTGGYAKEWNINGENVMLGVEKTTD